MLCTPDDCQKHQIQSSVPELFSFRKTPGVLYIYIYINKYMESLSKETLCFLYRKF